jgi:hypothetical protein
MTNMPPTLTREEFEEKAKYVQTFKVWIQVSPSLQHCLTITKEQAMELVEFGFSNGGLVFAISNLNYPTELELSTTSQWYDAWVLAGRSK